MLNGWCTDGCQNPTVDPANVVQALVDTLLDVFDATRDLYETLTVKEQRDYEQNLRSKGYPASRRIEYVKDERLGSDEAIVTDKAVVTRQFEIGYQTMGAEFAVGDGKLALLNQHWPLIGNFIRIYRLTTFISDCAYGPPVTDYYSPKLVGYHVPLWTHVGRAYCTSAGQYQYGVEGSCCDGCGDIGCVARTSTG
jgi:hypothetical protein